MKTKTFYGVKFNVYTDSKIDGDFIKPDEAVYFENDVEITGRLEVKYLKTEKSIVVGKSYIVTEWGEVGGSQEVGGYQKVGWYQEVGGDSTVGAGINVGLYIKVGGTLRFGKRLFAGICSWRDITDEEKTITCGKLEGGEVVHGIVKEVGLPEKKADNETIMVQDGKRYKVKILEEIE